MRPIADMDTVWRARELSRRAKAAEAAWRNSDREAERAMHAFEAASRDWRARDAMSWTFALVILPTGQIMQPRADVLLPGDFEADADVGSDEQPDAA